MFRACRNDYQQAGDAERVEPVAGVCAFTIPCKPEITAPGEDEGSGSAVGDMRWRIYGHRGLRDIGEARAAATVEESILVRGDVFLRLCRLRRFRSSVGPQRQCGCLGWRHSRRSER